MTVTHYPTNWAKYKHYSWTRLPFSGLKTKKVEIYNMDSEDQTNVKPNPRAASMAEEAEKAMSKTCSET
jgi:hypothetical protein